MIPLFCYADSSWDHDTLNTPQAQQFIRQRYSLASGWTPWFDSFSVNFEESCGFYADLYAIYNNNPPKPDDIAITHSDWIMLDKNGARLYIPWGPNINNSYEQYAADISNELFIQNWINQCKSVFASKNYKALYIDDVNLEFRVVEGNGEIPQLYAQIPWPFLVVEFVEQIRTAFPNITIIHNSIWFTSAPKEIVDRQILAANLINCERGFGDPNLNPTTFQQFCTYIDDVHNLGRNVIQMEYTRDNLTFKVACFLLMYRKGDLLCVQNMFPETWDSIVDIDTGNPDGLRKLSLTTGLWYREFEKIYVTVDFTKQIGTITSL